MKIHGSLWSEIIVNTIFLFFTLVFLLSLIYMIYKKKKVTIKQFIIDVFTSLLLSGLYCFYLTAYYRHTAQKALFFLEDAFFCSSKIQITYYDRHNPTNKKIAFFCDQDQISQIKDVLLKDDYLIRSSKGLAAIANPMEIFFGKDANTTLTILGDSGTIEIIHNSLKVRLASHNKILYSEIESTVLSCPEIFKELDRNSAKEAL